jgi:hypothetical protein
MLDIVQPGNQLARSPASKIRKFTPSILSWSVLVEADTYRARPAGFSQQVTTNKRWKLECTMSKETFEVFEFYMTKAGVSPYTSCKQSDVGAFLSVKFRSIGDLRAVDFVFEAFNLAELNQSQLMESIAQLQLEGGS